MPYASFRPYGSGRHASHHWAPQWRKPRRHDHRRAAPERNDNLFESLFSSEPSDGLLAAIFSSEPPARRGLPVRFRDPLTDRASENLTLGLFALFAPLLLPLGLLSVLGLCLARLWNASARRRALREAERARRALRRPRSSARLPPPEPGQLAEAWEKSRASLEWKILLGSLLSDLEPVVDQRHVRNQRGQIVGRNPGIRGWIFEHCPELRRHYKAMMAYKALAERLRRVCGLFDPDSAEALLGVRPAGRGETPAAPPGARARARTLLEGAPTLRALDDALRERLGLPRMHRERRRSA